MVGPAVTGRIVTPVTQLWPPLWFLFDTSSLSRMIVTYMTSLTHRHHHHHHGDNVSAEAWA